MLKNILKKKIKELVAERKEMFNKEDAFYAQYDKGYIHAMGDVLQMINEVNNA